MKHMVAFSKGSRGCLGINLAYAELYLCMAGLFRGFGAVGMENEEGCLELVGTGIDDVRCDADLFIPGVKVGSQGVRVRVLGKVSVAG